MSSCGDAAKRLILGLISNILPSGRNAAAPNGKTVRTVM
jgi:hypothetical protein